MSTNDRRNASDSTSSGRRRPVLHFAPARNWMNDPNGLIEWRGRFHLFYQYNPAGNTHQNIHWGHASSTDLWTWTDHPVALSPQAGGPDRDGCWSGAAVVHDGVPHLIYTGVTARDGELETELPCVAVAADDELISWVRTPENPVIAQPPAVLSTTAFRDHSLWRHGDVWRQAIGAGITERGGAILLYESADLRAWSYVGVMCAARDHGLRGAIWECPDVFWCGDTVVVIVSVVEEDQPQHAMWMTGTMSGTEFVPEHVGRCDAGGRYYAPQSCTVGDGRRIAFGWLRESAEELRGGDRSRVGLMSLPRELTVSEAGTLETRPASELTAARTEMVARSLIGVHEVIPLELDSGGADATEMVLTPGAYTHALSLTLCGAGCDDVVVELEPDAVTVREGEAVLAPQDEPGRERRQSTTLEGRPLRIFYDRGVLEVFGDTCCSPVAVICDRYGRYDALRIEVTARSSAEPTLLEVWSCGSEAPVTQNDGTATAVGAGGHSSSSMQNELGLNG